jgi:ankyrin repeat protein
LEDSSHASVLQLRNTLEEAGTFELLQFSTCHEIVSGLLQTPLDTWLDRRMPEIDARDSSGNTPLFWAARRADPRMLEILLARGANLHLENNQGFTALYFAAVHSAVECDGSIHLLLKSGADVNAASGDEPYKICTALGAAATTGHDVVTKLLLEYGADVDPPGYPPLCQAAWYGYHNVVRRLLEAGCDVDRQSPIGNTAIMNAVQSNHSKCVQLLLDRGAQLDRANNEDKNIVDLATLSAGIEVMQILEKANLKGLDASSAAQKRYMDNFEHQRDVWYVGSRAKFEDEKKAFSKLLESLRIANSMCSGFRDTNAAEESDREESDDEFFDATSGNLCSATRDH